MFDYLSLEARSGDMLRELRAEAEHARLARRGIATDPNTKGRIFDAPFGPAQWLFGWSPRKWSNARAAWRQAHPLIR
jgi:hypothetical protein